MSGKATRHLAGGLVLLVVLVATFVLARRPAVRATA
jgi:hypothetical protein